MLLLENQHVAYETFERTTVRVEDPVITVCPIRDGRIALNAAAARLLEQAGVKAVKILWDKTTCGIALEAARKSDPNAYLISLGDRVHQATLSAKTFLRHIGWSSDRRQTVAAKWNEQQKMLEATLPSQFVRLSEKKENTREGNAGR
jgi:hypothetical protein